ncbi:MAG: ATP-binding protein [Anaerolineae bacterium]
MPNPENPSADGMGWLGKLRQLVASIGAKIILPYLLLTLAVAGAGAYIVTRLVTNTLQERFNNQLLDAGRIVSERIVGYEKTRLEVLRAVAGSEGVPEALAAGDRETLKKLVPQIIINSTTDAVDLLDINGIQLFGWQRPMYQSGGEGEERSGADYSDVDDVRRVLDGYIDEYGDKRVILSQTPEGLMIFTIAPVHLDGNRVGAVMVGTYVREMLVELTEAAVARVTLYNTTGQVIDTTLVGADQADLMSRIQEPPEQYATVIRLLQESPEHYRVVSARAENEVPLREINTLDQQYVLAFGDWRLRDQSFGLFSVALPRNFIINTAQTNRTGLSLLFSTATLAVFGIGLLIAQRIVQPLHQLVRTALAVARGNLEQRTHISRGDEIGALAHSFDVMTENLAERNRQLVEKASELETILNSIADGVLVVDRTGRIVTSNPAARQILAETSDDFQADILRSILLTPAASPEQMPPSAASPPTPHPPRRYQIGDRVFSALTAPMQTPEGELLGTVIALRDITREAEAESLQDGFITTVSHELRTPLTAVKGYSDLLLEIAKTGLNENHVSFVRSINDNANQLVHHINKLIDITEIQAGTLPMRAEVIDFAALVAEVVETWRAKIEARDLTLTVSLPKNNLPVQGDSNRLRWAVDNLLSNAYNYTPTGTIAIHVFQDDDTARLDVTDTGVGVSAADQPYLFSRFFRANSSNEFTFNVDGVGLGLFVSRSIVEMHGGRAWATSKAGAGSTFSLALPVVELQPG